MDVIIYARVSQDRKGTGRSISEQISECEAWARRNGWRIHDVVSETGSASRFAVTQRPGWKRLVERLVSTNVQALLTWEGSRLTRDLTTYAEVRELCRRLGILWGYSGRLYDLADTEDRFQTGLDILIAEDEAARTSERVRRSITATKARHLPAGRLPWGYHRVYDPRTRQTVHVVLDHLVADLVSDAAASFLAGGSLRSIAKHWNELGVPTRGRSKTWDGRAVREVLMNPGYCGQHGSARIPAVLEPAKHQAVLDRLGQHKAPQVTPRGLLTGIASCATCGSHLVLGSQNSGRGPYAERVKVSAYHCSAHRGQAGHTQRREGLIDTFVVDQVLLRLSVGSLFRGRIPARESRNAAVRALQAEAQKDHQFLDEVRAAAEAHADRKLFSEMAPLVRARTAAVASHIHALLQLPDCLWPLVEAEDLPARWAGMELHERRAVISSLVSISVPRGRAQPVLTWKV